MSDLAERLKGVIEEKLAIARAAAVLKPGIWVALTTHDGWEFTGHSHVRAQEETAEKSTSRPVASNIADDLVLTRTAFSAAPPPAPSRVASHIAAHDPAWAIRQHEAALRVLERHRPIRRAADSKHEICDHTWADGDGWLAMWPCEAVMDLVDVYGVPVDTEEESR